MRRNEKYGLKQLDAGSLKVLWIKGFVLLNEKTERVLRPVLSEFMG